MKVTLIGSGNMGSALAARISKAGHALVITGRNADKANELARVTGAAFKDKAAADGADVVVVECGRDAFSAAAVAACRRCSDFSGVTGR